MITRPPLVLVLVCALLVLAGCTSSPSSAGRSSQTSLRVRCLSNPNETENRPLVFLFCVESP